MAVGVLRRAKKAASRLEHALLLDPTMAFTMSQQPDVGLSVTEQPSALHTEPQTLDIEHVLPATEDLQSHAQANKKRRSSKSKIPGEIRRSSSTPHMRNLALGSAGDLSPTADKRRNKLGYHRTSVACGHCRRRKIRCLVANDDPQGRCANCIRLKKECNFYPVEQTPEQQRLPSGQIKDAANGPPPSTTSSPRHPSSATGDKVDEFRPPFAAASSNHSARYGLNSDVELTPQMPGDAGMPVQHPSYSYPPSVETQWPTPAFLPSSSLAETSPTSSAYWRPSPSTANSVYGSESNVSGAHTPATMSSVSTMSFNGPSDNQGWAHSSAAPPTRSMSYGNIEGLPQQYSNPGLGIQQHDYPRRPPPYAYPTTIDTNHPAMHTSGIANATTAPLSAPILPNQQFAYPQAWEPYGGAQTQGHGHGRETPMQGRAMSAQWYHEHGQLQQVQEEMTSPMSYSHHPMQPYYSGT